VTSRNRERSTPPRTAFHGVCHPSTLEETSSDLHRACLARLCCAFRLSQPPDASFRPQPFLPCFMQVTPLGFYFQRFSLPGSEKRLTALPSLPAVLRRAPDSGEPKPFTRRRGSKGLRIRRVRIDKLGVTRGMPTDPLLALPLAEVFTPPASASGHHQASSHGLSRLAGRRTAHLDVGSAEFQRTGG
jgi:hypothetical protein